MSDRKPVHRVVDNGVSRCAYDEDGKLLWAASGTPDPDRGDDFGDLLWGLSIIVAFAVLCLVVLL